MKRISFILLLGLVLGVTGFELLYSNRTASHRNLEQTCGPELAWVQNEFKLNDQEFERIRRLHQAYKPVCTEYCRRVREKNQEIARLVAASTDITPPIQKALGEAADLRKECLAHMLQHFYAVSQAMPPEQGRRYLGRMEADVIAPTDQTMLSIMGQEPVNGHNED